MRTDFFTKFLLFWIGLAWVGFTAAIFGFFYWPIFAVYLSIGLYFSLINLNLKKIRTNWEIISLGIIVLIFLTLLSSITNPTIFTGRDQGSISQAAVELAKNHKLTFSNLASTEFFKIYGQGKALNFPGFYYTQSGELLTQFPIPYIAWLAIFYSFFTINGLIIANLILFIIFIFSIYSISRKMTNENFALLSTLFIISSFAFSWFFKFTLTENMALAILWSFILSSINLIEKFESKNFYYFFLSGLMLVFVRIEGLAFIAISMAIILYKSKNKIKKLNIAKINIRHFVLLFATALISITAIYQERYFFREIAKAIYSNFTKLSTGNSTAFELSIFKIFALYGLLPFFVLSILGLAWAFYKKNFIITLPFIIVSPTIIYIFNKYISADHPWMLRRYTFSLLPTAILYTTYLIFMCSKRKNYKILSLIFATILISYTSYLNLEYLMYSENKGLLKQTRQLADKFGPNDLILITPSANVDQWTLISGPLQSIYNKNAVYFFNPNDFDKINKDKFENIYLIASYKDVFEYQDLIKNPISTESYVLETSKLENTKETKLPAKKKLLIIDKIYKIK